MGEPGNLKNLKKQIILILPNLVSSYSSLKNLIIEIHQMAPSQDVILVHLDKEYKILSTQNFAPKLQTILAKMQKAASFGLRKNSIEVLTKISKDFVNSIIINIIDQERDEHFEAALKEQFLCVYDKNVEFLEITTTTALMVETTT